MKTQRSPKLLIFLTVLIDLLGFGIIIPILPVISSHYPVPALGGVGVAAGILMAAYSLLQMVCSPFWGRLSDRFGRRPILLLSLAGSTTSYLIFALADSYWMLLASRVLAGVCSANITAAQAYIADITSEKDRTAGMGLIGMAFGLGFAFGPVLGGGATRLWQVIHPVGDLHMGPGLAACAICGANLIWAALALPESLPPERRGQVHFRRFATTREALANLRGPAIGPLIILFFLATFSFANLEVSFSMYAGRVLKLDQEMIYGFFVFYGLLMALVQGWLVRKAIRYLPEESLMIPGLALLALGLVLLPLSFRIPYAMFTMIFMAAGQGIANPCILSLISRATDAQAQGNVFGTTQAASSLARIIGPIFGGIFFDFGPR